MNTACRIVPRLIDADQPDQWVNNPAVSGWRLNFNRVHFSNGSARNGSYAVTDGSDGQGLTAPMSQWARWDQRPQRPVFYLSRDAGNARNENLSGALRQQLRLEGNGGSRL